MVPGVTMRLTSRATTLLAPRTDYRGIALLMQIAAKSAGNQPAKIGFRTVIRHARHRDAVTVMGSALVSVMPKH